MAGDLTVEQAIIELCQTYPVQYVEITMAANRNGIDWAIKIGRGYDSRIVNASTLESAMAQVRQHYQKERW